MSPPPAGMSWKLAGWALLLPCVYLPTLAAPFDFVDDGSLVYPTAARSPGEWLRHVWERSALEFQTRGPFRPVCWAHWAAAADLLGPRAPLRRLARLAWAVLSTLLLLWLLGELGFPAPAAVAAAALAVWNPVRGEIWLGLGLTEAFAMPYALLALVAAIRAARSSRPLRWDVLALACLLAALGIKNTFAALVPPVVLLRLTAGRLPLREGWARHRRAAALLGLTLALPAGHFLLYRLGGHHSYEVQLTWRQGPRMLRAVAAAANWEFVLAGLALPLLASRLAGRRKAAVGIAAAGQAPTVLQGRAVLPGAARAVDGAATAARAAGSPATAVLTRTATDRGSTGPGCAALVLVPSAGEHEDGAPGQRGLLAHYRLALAAGLLLAGLGVGIYLPIDATAGRYTMPAVWGLDILVAFLLTALLRAASRPWKRVGLAALAGWLLFAGLTNLDRQWKYRARAELLWQALEFVEARAPRGAPVAWLGTASALAPLADMPFAEAAHFRWHLLRRRRFDLSLREVERADAAALARAPGPALVVAGTPPPQGDPDWELAQGFRVPYRAGLKSYACFVWSRRQGPRAGQSPTAARTRSMVLPASARAFRAPSRRTSST